MIEQARATLPFERPPAEFCHGDCTGCSIKLLAYLDAELDAWSARLDAGATPNLGELAALGRLCRQVAETLARNGQLAEASAGIELPR